MVSEPVVVAPAVVPWNETQIHTVRSDASEVAGRWPPEPIGNMNEPGPDATVGGTATVRSNALHVCTENFAAREVVTPAGTLLKVSVGVSSATALMPPAHLATPQNSIRPAATSSMMRSISDHGG